MTDRKKVMIDAPSDVDPSDPGYIRPQDLSKLIRKSEEHTARVNQERFIYPDPEELTFEVDGETLPFSVERFSIAGDIPEDGLDILSAHRKGRRNKGRQQQKTRNRGKGGGGKSRPLPNPAVVAQEVAGSLAGLRKASTRGNLQIAELNAEFLDTTKYRYFRDAYEVIAEHFHAIALSEVEPQAVLDWGKDVGYTAIASKANTRNQAVGILLHPRLKVLSHQEYDQVGNVQGIPDLRPALRVDVEDTTSGDKFSLVVVHLKSMRGGQKVTSAVRYRQLDILQNLLGSSFVGFVLGDFNFFLDDTTLPDGDPLRKAGYQLVYPNDHTATHALGGRIDGFWKKAISRKVGFYQVRQFWKNPKITRQFTDHGLLNIQVVFCEQHVQDPSSPSPGCGSGTGSDDEANTPVEVAFGGNVEEFFLAPWVQKRLDLLRRRNNG